MWTYEEGVYSANLTENASICDADDKQIVSIKMVRSGTNVYVAISSYLTSINEKLKETGKIKIKVPANAIKNSSGVAYPAHEIVYTYPVSSGSEVPDPVAKQTTWLLNGTDANPSMESISGTLSYSGSDGVSVSVANGAYVDIYKGDKNSDGTNVGYCNVYSNGTGGFQFYVDATISTPGEYHFYIPDGQLKDADSAAGDYYTDVHFVITVPEPEVTAKELALPNLTFGRTTMNPLVPTANMTKIYGYVLLGLEGYDNPIVANGTKVTVVSSDGSYNKSFVCSSGSELDTSYANYVCFFVNSSATAEGTYTFTIPAKSIFTASGDYFPEITFTATIPHVAVAKDASVTSTPTEGVDELSAVVMTISPEVKSIKDGAVASCSNGQSYTMTLNYDATVTINAAITEAGEYTFTIPEGALVFDNGDYNTQFTVSATVNQKVNYKEWTIDPDPAGSYDSFDGQKITITFPNIQALDFVSGNNKVPFTLTYPDGTTTTCSWFTSANKLYISNLTFTKGGTYKFSLPAGTLWEYDKTQNTMDAIEFEYTLKGVAQELAAPTLKFAKIAYNPLVPTDENLTKLYGNVVMGFDGYDSITLDGAKVTITNENGEVKGTYNCGDASSLGDGFGGYLYFTISTAITAEGTYTFTIPAKSIFTASGDYFPEITFTATIPHVAVATEATVQSVPADGVDELSAVVMTISPEVKSIKEDAKATCSNGQSYSMTLNADATVTINAAITEAGEYTFTIPEGALLFDKGDYNKEFTVKATVNAKQPAQVTVDPSNEGTLTRLPEKVTVTYPNMVVWDNTVDNTVKVQVTGPNDYKTEYTLVAGSYSSANKPYFRITNRDVPSGTYNFYIPALKSSDPDYASYCANYAEFSYTVEAYVPKAVEAEGITYATGDDLCDFSAENLTSLSGSASVKFSNFETCAYGEEYAANYYVPVAVAGPAEITGTAYAYLNNGGIKINLNNATYTTAGEYTFTIPEKAFLNKDGDWLAETVLKATVAYTPVAVDVYATVSGTTVTEEKALSSVTFAIEPAPATLVEGATVTCDEKSYSIVANEDGGYTVTFDPAITVDSDRDVEFTVAAYSFKYENGDWNKSCTFKVFVEHFAAPVDMTTEVLENETTKVALETLAAGVDEVADVNLTFNQEVSVEESAVAYVTKVVAEEAQAAKGVKTAAAAESYPLVASGKVLTVKIDDPITDPGTYKFSIPAATVKFANGDYNAAAIEFTTVVNEPEQVVEPTSYYSVDPENNSEVETLPTVKVTLLDKFAVDNLYVAQSKEWTVTKDGTEVKKAYVAYPTNNVVTFNTGITEAGTYVVTIPENSYGVYNSTAEGYDWLPEITLTYTVTGKEENTENPETVEFTVDPTTDATYEVLPKNISVTYKGLDETLTYVVSGGTHYAALSINGGEPISVAVYKSYSDNGTATMTVFDPTTNAEYSTAGTYVFTIPAGTFKTSAGTELGEVKFTYTVGTAVAPEPTYETANVTVGYGNIVDGVAPALTGYYLVTFNNEGAIVSVDNGSVEATVVKDGNADEAFKVTAFSNLDADTDAYTNQLIVNFGEKNYGDGTYVITIPQGAVKNESTGNYFDAFSVTITVKAEEQGGDQVVEPNYTVTGTNYTSNTEISGNYFVYFNDATKVELVTAGEATVTKDGKKVDSFTLYIAEDESGSAINAVRFYIASGRAITADGTYTFSIPEGIVKNSDTGVVYGAISFTQTLGQEQQPGGGDDQPKEVDPVTVPYVNDLSATDENLTIIDANGDNKTWSWYEWLKDYWIEFNNNADMDDWLITPPVTMKGGRTYAVRYKLHAQSSQYPEKFEVYAGNLNTVAGMTTQLIAPTTVTWESAQTVEASFSPESDGNYYFGFHGISDKGMYNLFLDGIEIVDDNAAIPAAPANVKAEAVANDVTISWDAVTKDNKDADLEYEVTYTVTRQPGDVVVASEISETSVTNRILVAGTFYYDVVANCGGKTSEAAKSNEITTEAMVWDLPYSNTFDKESSLEGYTVIDANEDDCTWYYSPSGFAKIDYNKDNTTAMNDWLITPGLKLEAGKTYTAALTVGCGGANWPEKIELYTGSANTVAAMTSQILESTTITSKVECTAEFTVGADGNYFLGIHGVSDAAMFYISLYNLSVTEKENGGTVVETPTPAAPANVVAAYNDGTVTVTWDAVTTDAEGNALPEGTVVSYAVSRTPNEEGISVVNVDTNAFTEELSAEGTYTYAVVAKIADKVSEAATASLEIPAAVVPPTGDAEKLPYENTFASQEDFDTMSLFTVNKPWFFLNNHAEVYVDYEYYADKDAWMFTPAINFPDANSEYSVIIYVSAQDSTEAFEVSVGESATVEGMTIKAIEPTTITSDDYVRNVGVFRVPEAGNYYVGVHACSKGGQGADNIIRVNNLRVEAGNLYVSTVLGDSDLYVQDREIVVNNAEGAAVAIFTIDGKMVAQESGSDSYRFAVNNGIYIVRVGNATAKVVVR
jgi:hypothetical protein